MNDSDSIDLDSMNDIDYTKMTVNQLKEILNEKIYHKTGKTKINSKNKRCNQ